MEERILLASLKLITQKGFHGAPVSLIAKEAGVAAGSIYHYFENKNDLINSLYAFVKQQMEVAIRDADDPNLPYQARFEALWLGVFGFFLQNPDYFRFSEQYTNSPFVMQTEKEKGQHYFVQGLDFLSIGQKEGHIKSMNLELMSRLVFGSIASSVKLALEPGKVMNRDHLREALAFCWEGIKK